MSIKKWPGAVVSDVPVEPAGNYQNSAASGVWTLEQQAYWESQGLWPVPGALSPSAFIENLFSTYLYTGNGSTQTITNGIDLAGEGGMVWTKDRGPVSASHYLTDTAIGIDQYLKSDVTNAQQFSNTRITSLNLDGYTLGSNAATNASGASYASWTFRKQPKFFDVVTWTGNGANRTIAHNLGSVPGSIWVKRTDTTSNWQVYHRSLANTQYLVLNSTAAAATGATRWNSTTPTSSVFSLGTDTTVNASAGTYIAYIFAHDAGGFGLTGTDNVISCGSFTTDASGNATVTLGYEPQYILMKLNVNGVVNWVTYDIMRGWGLGNVAQLYPNITQAEDAYTGGPYFFPTATGFVLNGTFGLGNNQTNAYIAIRRGPMKTPEAGTEVFDPDYNASFPQPGVVTTGFVTDWNIYKRTGGGSTIGGTRLTGGNYLFPDATDAESAGSSFLWDNNTGLTVQSLAGSGNATINWAFRRAPGFMDVVAYTGAGGVQTVTHSLGVAPELMIIKHRNGPDDWPVYHSALGNTKYLWLNSSNAESNLSSQFYWNNTTPTSSVFTLGGQGRTNDNGGTYIAYLFATLPGVSKVGSYTGTAADINVDCGFSAGARFILIKRTDSAGDWYVWDSARGIVSGNDPYLLLNSGAAQVTNTDYIDPLSSGFTVTSNASSTVNVNTGTYIFLAIA